MHRTPLGAAYWHAGLQDAGYAGEPLSSERFEVDRLNELSDDELEHQLTFAASFEQLDERYQLLLVERETRRLRRAS